MRRPDPKHNLPRLAIDANPYKYQQYLPSPTSSISSARASIAPSLDTPTSGIFYALCLYDFEASDSDQLTFKKNDVLEIVKQEESGWWAALRDDNRVVGWIPSAYVEPISEERAERVRSQQRERRSREPTIAEQVFSPDSIVEFMSPYGLVTPADGIRGFDWMPMVEGAKDSPLRFGYGVRTPAGKDFPKDVTSALSPSLPELDGYSDQILEVPTSAGCRPYPPSPMAPIPHPPNSAESPSRSRRSHVSHSFLSPLSPSPSLSPSSPSSTPSKGRLDSAAILISRHLRRRPVLIDDSSSLSRLSTLFETSNVGQVDLLASSPVVTKDMDAFSRASRGHTPRLDKIKQITGDDEAQAFHNAKVAQSSLPWFLRPDHGDDEIKVEFDGTVAAGTLPALVERLTVDPLKQGQEIDYRQAFLTTFRTFATADEVFNMLLDRYHIQPPSCLSEAEVEVWREKKLLPTQRRVLAVFLAWLENHSMIQDDPPIACRLQDFLTGITEPRRNRIAAKQVMDILERLTFAVPATPLSATLAHKRRKTKSGKKDLLKVEPTLLAEHLSLYEHKLYSKVHPQQCLEYSRKTVLSSLHAFCATHDRLAGWVKWSILQTDTVPKRADMVDHWIKIAEKCRSMNNFSSMSAIVTALESVVVTRLHLTWAHVGRASQLGQLVKLNDPTGNFATFRTIQQSAEGPCVPFITMHLTDINHIGDQYLDNAVITANSSRTMINFIKRQKLSNTVTAMLRHQGKFYPFAEDAATMSYVEANLLQFGELDQAAFWTKSQEVQQAEVTNADIRKGLEAAGF